MESNILLCVLIGLPGSGKSTLAKLLKKEFSSNLFEVICISYDEFSSIEEQEEMVLKLTSQTDSEIFKESRKHYVDSVESVLNSIKTDSFDDSSINLQLNKNKKLSTKYLRYLIILDDNFYYKSMRYKIYQLAANHSVGFCQLYLECDLKEAIERNSKRAVKVKKVVIETMNKRLEAPESEQNSWETNSLTLASMEANMDPHMLQNIKEFISKNFVATKPILNPERNCGEKLASQNINMENILHQSDLVLRSLVSEKIKAIRSSVASSELKQIISTVGQRKSELLKKIRSSDLKIPCSVCEKGDINHGELLEFLQHHFHNEP